MLFAIAAVTCGFLSWTAWRYVFEFTGADAHILADRAGVIWSERLWKFPLIAAFALMALHFAVGALKEARGQDPDDEPHP